ncbi:MAG: amino acid ABC transporter permease [Lachnospiraceae bacterium]|nr:amino acid ABC transporter permease [Lachnospiraceae bacterium]
MQIFSPEYFFSSFSKLLPFLPLTVLILVIAMLISFPLSIGLAWLALRKSRIVRGIMRVYVQIVRGTPFIVLLFIIYFGLPMLFLKLWGIDMNGWNKAIYIIITMVLFTSCRMSEALRSAYLAVPEGQTEATLSCGLSPFQTLLHVTAPQALLIALPNLANLVCSGLLETATGFSIGIVDFVGNARLINTREYGVHVFEIYLAVALVYWAMAHLISLGFGLLEGHLRRKMGLQEENKTEDRERRGLRRLFYRPAVKEVK